MINKDFRLELKEGNDGLQVLELHKVTPEGNQYVCSLDMSNIYEQITPQMLILHEVREIQNTLQIAEYSLNNHKHDSTEQALENYKADIEAGINRATLAIANIVQSAYPHVPTELTPF